MNFFDNFKASKGFLISKYRSMLMTTNVEMLQKPQTPAKPA